MFIEDIASRITGHVQIATDPHRSYVRHIKAFFGEDRHSYSYGIEHKTFTDAFVPAEFPKRRKNGIPKIANAERKAVVGNPDLRTTTTSHIERFFLTMRQELKRYQRLGLGYSKDIRMHRLGTALHIGLYNLVRRHFSLDGQTPAQAAGIEEKRWGLEDVVALMDGSAGCAVPAGRLSESAIIAGWNPRSGSPHWRTTWREWGCEPRSDWWA